MASSSTSNSTNSPLGLTTALGSGRNEGNENSSENLNSTAPPALPALVSSGGNKENEENEENEADEEGANSATSPNEDDSPQVTYSPMTGAYSPGSPGRDDDEPPQPSLNQREVEMGVRMQTHGFFLTRLTDALAQATADHVATYDHVERSLNQLQEQILRRVQRSADAARYLPMYFEEDPQDPRKMKRRRQSPSSASDKQDKSQSSSCGPGCNGS